MLFQGQEFGVDRAVPLLRRPRRELARAVRDGPRRVPRRSSRRWRRPTAQAAAPPTRRAARRSSAASSTRRERDRHARSSRCTATCSRCAASDPAFAQQRAVASTARCWATRRSCCASAPTTAAGPTTGCCSSTWAPTCDSRRSPSRCWRRRAEAAGGASGRARRSRYGGSGDAGARPPTTAGVLPGESALVLGPGDGA